MTKENFEYPNPKIIVIEGINGVGKTTLFNMIKSVSTSDDGVGFLDFPNFHKYKDSGPIAKATYVNLCIQKVWGKYPVIVADRWLITEHFYQILNPSKNNPSNSYLRFVNDEYKKLTIPTLVYLKKPKNIFVSYYRMLKRNKEQNKRDHFSFFTYFKLHRIYYKKVAKYKFCEKLQGDTIYDDVFTVRNKINEYLSDNIFALLEKAAGPNNYIEPFNDQIDLKSYKIKR